MSAEKQRRRRVQQHKAENPTVQERRGNLTQPKSERHKKVEPVAQYGNKTRGEAGRQAGMEAAWQQDKKPSEKQQKNLLAVKRTDQFSMSWASGAKKWENKLHVNKYSKHLPPTPVLPPDPAMQTKCTDEHGSPPPKAGLGTGASLRGKTDRSSQVSRRFLLSSG